MRIYSKDIEELKLNYLIYTTFKENITFYISKMLRNLKVLNTQQLTSSILLLHLHTTKEYWFLEMWIRIFWFGWTLFMHNLTLAGT